MTDGPSQVFLGTHSGMAIRFPETDVRPMGRTAYGVRGITLRDDDRVVAMEVISAASDATVMTVCENGYGKRTPLDEYRVQSRGGVGIISIHTTDRNGRVVGIACVRDEDELLLITQQGKILRMPTSGTRPIGRATQGVRLIGIEAEDRVVSVVRLAERDDERDDGQDNETSTVE
jgi:DNA gyrase subunit A